MTNKNLYTENSFKNLIDSESIFRANLQQLEDRVDYIIKLLVTAKDSPRITDTIRWWHYDADEGETNVLESISKIKGFTYITDIMIQVFPYKEDIQKYLVKISKFLEDIPDLLFLSDEEILNLWDQQV